MARKSAKQQGIEARTRIDLTKTLTLDERVALGDKAMTELGIAPTVENGPKLAKWLQKNGYEPMMFKHACNIVMSRR